MWSYTQQSQQKVFADVAISTTPSGAFSTKACVALPVDGKEELTFICGWHCDPTWLHACIAADAHNSYLGMQTLVGCAMLSSLDGESLTVYHHTPASKFRNSFFSFLARCACTPKYRPEICLANAITQVADAGLKIRVVPL